MEPQFGLNLGASTPSSTETYTGRHRNLGMLYGIGLIPHGDRNRVKPEYGIEHEYVERDSVDKYSKYYS